MFSKVGIPAVPNPVAVPAQIVDVHERTCVLTPTTGLHTHTHTKHTQHTYTQLHTTYTQMQLQSLACVPKKKVDRSIVSPSKLAGAVVCSCSSSQPTQHSHPLAGAVVHSSLQT